MLVRGEVAAGTKASCGRSPKSCLRDGAQKLYRTLSVLCRRYCVSETARRSPSEALGRYVSAKIGGGYF